MLCANLLITVVRIVEDFGKISHPHTEEEEGEREGGRRGNREEGRKRGGGREGGQRMNMISTRWEENYNIVLQVHTAHE